MNLLASPFPEWLLWLANGLAVLLLLHAAARIRWLQLEQAELTSWFGGTTLILLLWQLQASVEAGITFHLLGATALTLIAGRERALLGMAVIIAADTYQGHGEWLANGLSWFICALLPVTVTTTVLQLARRYLPANFFVYIFLNCFATGALCMWLSGAAACLLLGMFSASSSGQMFTEQFPYYFLLGFPEAFTTGFNLTVLVIWRPQWVASFDDGFYLLRK
ncbi:energy-coupling factor ABC transporter permease [Chitinilyticum aquatile]|uniref:energy-coupling factor ABC transporter permease n=1 Tax=Chitinilyticum aquatile TaxID=362520 RepID=UPI0004005B6C|nr:energy-coupling factor ABC transporter permease [Chitinilyticum aquatile]